MLPVRDQQLRDSMGCPLPGAGTSISGTSTAVNGLVPGKQHQFVATSDCWILFSSAGTAVTAGVGSTGFYLPANQVKNYFVTTGRPLAQVIQNSAAGVLNVCAMEERS